MLYDSKLSQEMASELLKVGIYIIGFYFPLVPTGQARIRVQLSAIHTLENLDAAISAFIKVGKKLKIISKQNSQDSLLTSVLSTSKLESSSEKYSLTDCRKALIDKFS